MKKFAKFLTAVVLLALLSAFGTLAYASEAVTEERYAGAPAYSSRANEVINFTSRTVSLENYTAGKCPTYSRITGQPNSCGAVAGAEIVAFYDKYFPNLIPDWTSHYANGNYRIQDRVHVPALLSELYTLMRTNVDDVGVSENDFKNGLKTYVNNHGCDIEYQSAKTLLGALNFDACRNAIDNNKVIALFVSAGDFYSVSPHDGYDVVTPTTIAGSHIMVAYGYMQLKYYNTSGLFRTDTYLIVATGLDAVTIGMYKIDAKNLNSAYIINIS